MPAKTLAAGLLAVAVAGCSSGSGDPAPGPASSAVRAVAASPTVASGPLPDPCALLSRAQVSKALAGAGAGSADPSMSARGQRSCRWDSAGHGFVQVVVNHSDARHNAAASRGSLGSLELVDVPGASFGYLAGHGWVAGLQVGSVFVQVSVTPTDRAAVLQLAKAAAAAA
jgi:hypothetical protein